MVAGSRMPCTQGLLPNPTFCEASCVLWADMLLGRHERSSGETVIRNLALPRGEALAQALAP